MPVDNLLFDGSGEGVYGVGNCMDYSLEFFKQRSFEVVWAVFRVAESVGRPELKKALESKALAYLSVKDFVALEELEEVIRLASHIGEVNAVNTKVLTREIGNLRTALQEIHKVSEDVAAAKLHRQSEGTIEEIFSKPPMLFADFARLLQHASEKSGNSPAMSENESGNDVVESGKGSFNGGMDMGNRGGISGIKNDANTISAESHAPVAYESETKTGNVFSTEQQPHQKSPANESPAMSHQESGNVTHEIYSKADQDARQLTSIERKKLILSVIQHRTMCHINDIIAVLPGISDRTLRYDIKTLADQHLIERVGTGGPNSFLRVKGRK